MLTEDVQAEINRLVLELVPQVQAEARKYFQRAPHALERDELEGIGNDALVWACEHWEDYCRKHGYSPAATHYFRAYALRRIRGAILDHLRDLDWVSRSVRSKYKLLQEVPDHKGFSEGVLAAETGLPVKVIRATIAAVARRPVSLDERTEDVPGHEGVETQAVAGGVLAAVGQSRSMLPLAAQAVVALRYYFGMSVPEIAVTLSLEEREVQDLHDSSVLVIHQVMLTEVA